MGDLINRVYLEIDLPKIDLIKNSVYWNFDIEIAKKKFDIVSKYYDMVKSYLAANLDYARKINILLKTNNITSDDIFNMMSNDVVLENLINKKEQLRQYLLYDSEISEIDEIFEKNSRSELSQQLNQIDISQLCIATIKNLNTYHYGPEHVINLSNLKKNHLSKLINTDIKDSLNKFFSKVQLIYVKYENIYQQTKSNTYCERYKFAWVEEIGHAIIDMVDIRIGNEIIDRHNGDWYVLFNKLCIRQEKIENYNKMIGNIKSLTIFDDQIKESYRLVVPLQFWFCRYTGLSLPIISLKYHDVTLSLKFKSLSKLCYTTIDSSVVNVENFQSHFNLNIENAKLYIEYIYLDTSERIRFAQSSHEYLIEFLQFDNFENIDGKEISIHINFSHPTKYIIWTIQPNDYRDNFDGRTKCQWNNFGMYDDKSGSPIDTAYIRINSYNRTDSKQDFVFYNYVHPLLYFNHSPTDGVGVYSFGLKPLEHQPSGSINLGRIDDFRIVLNLKKEFVEYISHNTNPGAFIGVYAVSYNVLRIMSGMGSLAFHTSISRF